MPSFRHCGRGRISLDKQKKGEKRRTIVRVEKQSSLSAPPEHPGCPPYNPGSFPPFTKSKSTGKKTEKVNVTFIAADRLTGEI